MGTLIVYKWLSPLPSRRRPLPVLDEIETEESIFAPLPSWYTSGEQAEVHLLIRPYLEGVIRNVRAVTEDFTQSLQYLATCKQLATSVCEALLVIDSVQIPGVQECLMCESPVAGQESPLGPIPHRSNKLRFTVSNNPYGAPDWTLEEILVYPSWRVDSPPTLCAFHSHEFRSALESVSFGCVHLPIQSPERRRSV